jgi:hypothetical protein
MREEIEEQMEFLFQGGIGREIGGGEIDEKDFSPCFSIGGLRRCQ